MVSPNYTIYKPNQYKWTLTIGYVRRIKYKTECTCLYVFHFDLCPPGIKVTLNQKSCFQFFQEQKEQNSINFSFDRPERISHRTSEGLEHLLNKSINSKHTKSLVQKRKKWYVSMNGVVLSQKREYDLRKMASCYF